MYVIYFEAGGKWKATCFQMDLFELLIFQPSESVWIVPGTVVE